MRYLSLIIQYKSQVIILYVELLRLNFLYLRVAVTDFIFQVIEPFPSDIPTYIGGFRFSVSFT